MDGNGDRQRLVDLERRMQHVEEAQDVLLDRISEVREEVRVGFARMETAQEKAGAGIMDLRIRDLVVLGTLFTAAGADDVVRILEMFTGG